MTNVRSGLVALATLAALTGSREAAAQCVGRPTDGAGYQGYAYGAATVKSYATNLVRVHYATSGSHAPDLTTSRADGVPDMVAFAGDTGEQALTKYGQMGFKMPPSDVGCMPNGDDEKLDIYLVSFAGADGTTVPTGCQGRVCPSYVLCESTFAGRGYKNAQEGFLTVVTHELFHTVQNAYDEQLDRFWAEGSAQWAMKTVHPELLDFERNLPAFFADSSRSIDTQPSGVTAEYLYGSAVWPLFLTTKFGPDTVRKVFDAEVDGTESLAAVNAVLQTMGSSLTDAFPLFDAWNAGTKAYAGTTGYPNAASYPGVKVLDLVDGTAGITTGLGSFTYLASAADAPQKISLDTDPARNAGLLVPLDGSGKAQLDKAVTLPATAEGAALVIVAGITTKKTDAPFTLHLGPPDAASSSGSSGSGGSSSGGGCAASGTEPAGLAWLGGAVLAFALGVARRRR